MSISYPRRRGQLSGFLPDRDRRRLLDLLTGAEPATYDAGERYFGADLSRLSEDELLAERARIRWRLSFDPTPHWWWLERLALVEAALARRKEVRDGRR